MSGADAEPPLTDTPWSAILLSALWVGKRMHFRQLKRRDFITLVGGAAAAWPLAARAQGANVPRIGFLRLGPPPSHAKRVEALRTGLRELGYIEGRNIAFEFRWAETVEQLSKFAAELVRMNVDVIFATSSTEVGAVQHLTK